MKNFNHKVSLEKNPIISIDVTHGHFSTRHVHTNYYLDVGSMKANAFIARDVARELAIPYISSTLVDTIVCMENTKLIGAFLAQELLHDGTAIMNAGGDINVVTPMSSVGGQFIFYDNEIDWIKNKNILLLTATLSSEMTLEMVLECLNYYNGHIKGISTLFSYSKVVANMEISTLFTPADIPGCKIYNTKECEMCKAGQKLDAFISNEGYKKI